MDKNAIKKFAIRARRELITRVSTRAAMFGVTEEGYGEERAISVGDRVLSAEEIGQRAALPAQGSFFSTRLAGAPSVPCPVGLPPLWLGERACRRFFFPFSKPFVRTITLCRHPVGKSTFHKVTNWHHFCRPSQKRCRDVCASHFMRYSFFLAR